MREVNAKSKRLVHISMSQRLYRTLLDLEQIYGKRPAQLAEHFLKTVLPIAEQEKSFRLMPEQFIVEPVPVSCKVWLTDQEADFLSAYAAEADNSISQQACELLWFVIELQARLERPGLLLRKEEFVRRIKDLLQIRRTQTMAE